MTNKGVAVLAVLLLASCSGSPLYPTEPFDSGVPMLVGVSVHGPAPDGMDLVRRDEDRLTWIDQARGTGALPLVIVGYGTHESIPERCAMAANAGAWIELWNEPNLPGFWGYNADTGRPGYRTPDPEQWVALVRGCREAAPGATIMGPGIGGSRWDWAYLERAVAAGMMDYVDLVSVHGYATTPERLGADIAKVRQITGSSRAGISEWGFKADSRQAEKVRAALATGTRAALEFLIFYHEAGDGNGLTSESLAALRAHR